jgi:hypothetical protein
MKTNTNYCPEGTRNGYEDSKSSIKGFMMLLFFILFFANVSYAQQPACNLTGQLKGMYNPAGGSTVVINSEAFNSGPSTTYDWSFNTNTSGATIVKGEGTSTIHVRAGTHGGNFTIKLIVTNPGQNGEPSMSCSCAKSVSVTKK